MIKQFWILEIKQNFNGEFEHNVLWAWDADPDTALVKAKAKFHDLFKSEDTLNVKLHTAVIIDADGLQIDRESIVHASAPVVEEMPEE